MVSRTFRMKLVVMFQRAESSPTFVPFQSQNLTVYPNVSNQLPSNVASYSRRKVRLFIPLWKPKNSRNSANWIVYELLYFERTVTVRVTSGSALNSWHYHLPIDNITYCNCVTVTGVQLYRVIIGNGIGNWSCGRIGMWMFVGWDGLHNTGCILEEESTEDIPV